MCSIEVYSSVQPSVLYSCVPCRLCRPSGQWHDSQCEAVVRVRPSSWISSLPTLISTRDTDQGEEGLSTQTLGRSRSPGDSGSSVVTETETGSSYCHADPVRQSLRTMWCNNLSRHGDRTGECPLTTLQTTPCLVSREAARLTSLYWLQVWGCKRGEYKAESV